jgi:hypothetical protein
MKGMFMNCVPAGTYFVGDPCYVINHSDSQMDQIWSDFCDHKWSVDGPFEKNGIILWGESTLYGDGVYENEFFVDSGLIGVASVAHLSDEDIKKLEKIGRVVTFTEEVVVSFESDGTIKVNDISIFTGDED